MVMSVENRIKLQETFQSLLDHMDQSFDDRERIDRIEEELFDDVRELSRQMLQAAVEDVSREEQQRAPDVIGRADAADLKRLDTMSTRRLVTLFGELSISGPVYAVRAKQKVEYAPVAERLGLPEGEFSYLFQNWAQRLCVRNAFHDSRDMLDELLNQRVSVRSLEHMNRHMAADVEVFREQQGPPPAAEEGELLVTSADATGVPMAHRDGKMQMAYIGACYSINRHVRTADDILDETLRRRSQESQPRPLFKRLHADMTRAPEEAPDTVVDGRVSVFTWLEHEVETRRQCESRPVICLMDGEHALWDRKSDLLGEGVIEILDFWHFLDRLRQVSKALTSTEAEADVFLEERLRRVLEGGLGRVMGGLRQMLKTRRLRKADRETVESALTYFQNNRDRMRYDEYLAAGYPIASGVIEGSCRHIVEDRLDGTGMRWELAGAVAMLHTRSIALSDDWNEYQAWRIKTEQSRLYAQTAAS